jgi:hypothetical protein
MTMELVPVSDAWLVAISSSGLLHAGIPVDHFGIPADSAQEWADKYSTKGFAIKKVAACEYSVLVRQSRDVDTDLRAKIPRYIGTNQPIDMSLDDVRNAPNGLRVVIRHGEASQKEILWCEPEFGLLLFDENCNGQGEPGLLVANLAGHAVGIGFAGHASETKTWWRYASEGYLGAGEHCLQVLAMI